MGATSERNICQVSIHPLVQQMFKETHSLLVTVLGTGDTTMNKVDKVSEVDGSNTHNMNFLGGICVIIKRNHAVMLERNLKVCFLDWVIKEMTLKLKPDVIIRNGHVAIQMKKKMFQREGTDNIKAL